jgi:hypothetical protein
MAACSTYLANALLDHVLGVATYTPPATIYLALAEEDFTEAGSGTELSGGSYARVACTWDAASSGATANDTLITIAAMPACALSHLSLWDAATAGNMLIYGEFDDVVVLASGEDFAAALGELDIALV